MELIELKRCEAKDFEEYFKDCGSEYFDCGEGYYQDEAVIYVQTPSGKIYQINMTADCVGDKTDYGDIVYYVDEITSVSYIEISRLQFITWSIDELKCERDELEEKLHKTNTKILELTTEQLNLEK